MIAMPQVESEGMQVIPVAQDEIVYISADHETLASPMTAKKLAQASLVMPETTWRSTDSIRILLRQLLHETGSNPPTRIEVEDVEIAVELVGLGLADSVIPRGAAVQLLPAARAERRLGLDAPQALRPVRDRAPRRRHAVARGAADDRAGHQADPVHRDADLSD